MKLPKFITRNLLIKFSSIVLAVIVWLMVQGEVTTEKVFHDVPYELEIHPNMMATDKDNPSLSVKLSGPSEIMENLTSRSIRVKKNLKSITTPGAVHFSITPENIVVPPRVQVLDIRPRDLIVVLDELAQKELPVKAQFVGKPEKGFQMTDFVINPTVTKVEGTRQKIQELKFIQTQSVILTGRTRSFVQTVPLKTLLKGHKQDRLAHVDIYVKIEPELSRKVIEGVPLTVLQGSGGAFAFRFSILSVNVTVEGSRDAVERTRSTDLKAYVDIIDLKPGKYQLPIAMMGVQGLSILHVEPQVAEIEILESEIR